MSAQPYRNDDEDLFDYQPTKSIADGYISDPVADSNNATTENTLLDDIYRQMDNLVHSEGKESVSEFRIRLSDSLNEAYHDYLQKSTVVSHVQAVTFVLDELTNNRFSQVYFYKTIEQSIFRRLNIHFLLDAIVDDGGDDHLSFKEFLGKMNISISDDFIPVYFTTLLSISNHALNLERSIYISLAEKLGYTPNPVAIHSDPTASDIIKAIPLTASQFKQYIYDSVFEHISKSEDFISSIHNIFTADAIIKIATV